MRGALIVLGATGSATLGAAAWWRRHRRVGSAWVNRVLDPWLVEHGMVDWTHGEIGLIEHVGRSTGTVRSTPVHPVPTADGFRIIVPLGSESQWARNVLAAGGCRLRIGDVSYALADPRLVTPIDVDGLPRLGRRLTTLLGFRYLLLSRSGPTTGSVEAALAA